MKAKDAHEQLSIYFGDELYRKARELFRSEVDALLSLRWHSGETLDPKNLEGVLDQVSSWFRIVARGLNWSSEDIPEKIISWERGGVYAYCKVVDPKLLKWGERTRKAMRKGKPLPMLEAMEDGDLEAASAFMLGKIVDDAKRWTELEERRKAFLAKLDKKPCLYGVEARKCPFQESFSMVSPLPTSTSDIAFACKQEPNRKCLYNVKA